MAIDPIHGHWQVYYLGERVLVVKGWGTWNVAAATGFAADARATIDALKSPWAILADYRDFEAAVLDAEPIISGLHRYGLERGCAFVAELRGRSTLGELQRREMHVAHPSAASESFSDPPEAVAWLREQGFELSLERVRELLDVPPPRRR
ncbi:MAG: hypothetical protein AAGE01_02230 [Pseudomonadota bacterium]